MGSEKRVEKIVGGIGIKGRRPYYWYQVPGYEQRLLTCFVCDIYIYVTIYFEVYQILQLTALVVRIGREHHHQYAPKILPSSGFSR